MSPDPLVSVIIPTHNRVGLLAEAVSSVLAQSCARFELLVVDDGSTDGTSRFLAGEGGGKKAFPDPRVRYIPIPHSGMPGLVRNRGAARARGRFLAFLDSDDLWLREKLELQLKFMADNPGCRVSHTREKWVRNGREVSQAGQRHRRAGMIFREALKKCVIGPSTVMLEKSLFEEVGGFREDLEIAEDYELWLRVTAKEEVGYLDRPLTIKRAGHGDQLSEKYGHIEYFRIQGLRSLVDSSFFPGSLAVMAEEELAVKCGIYAAGCGKRGRLEEAREYEQLARFYRRSGPVS